MVQGIGGFIGGQGIGEFLASATAPTITNAPAHSIAENSAFSFDYTVTNMNGELPTISGPDVLAFTWEAQGGDVYRLGLSAQDYETPADDDGDNVFSITITADNGVDDPVTLDVDVTVTNVLEQTITDQGNGSGTYPLGSGGLAKTDAQFTDWVDSFTDADSNNAASLPATLTEAGSPYAVTFTKADAPNLIRNFSVTEVVSNLSPNPFDLQGPISRAIPGQTYQAEPFIVSGLPDATSVAIVAANGEYSIDDGAWTGSPGTVQNGDTVRFRVTASLEPYGVVEGVLSVGAYSASFYVVTGEGAAGDVGLSFVIKDGATGELITDTTIDLRVLTQQFGGTLLGEFDDIEIDEAGRLEINITSGSPGQSVFVEGLLANGKYIAGETLLTTL